MATEAPAASTPTTATTAVAPATSPRIVRLNVGGRSFCTSETTLLWCGPHTFFEGLLSGRIASLRDETGAFFIDRDPDLFALILNYLRSRDIRLPQEISVAALRQEADFFGITSLVQKLDLCSAPSACGALLFHAKLQSPAPDPVVAISGCHNLVAVAQLHRVTCWKFEESTGWEVVARSPALPFPVQLVALTVKLGSRGDNIIAFSSDSKIRLWMFGEARDGAEATEDALSTFNLGVKVDSLFFIGNQLVALSNAGTVGVRHSMTQIWQVQRVQPIFSYDRAGNLLLLGCGNGSIYSVDLEKFPLRLKDNDLLVNHFYEDGDGTAITALSAYLTPSTGAETWLEIAYGTAAGVVRVLVQHPETVGQPPMLLQTYQVHTHPVKSVMLSEKFLISVCVRDNHTRTWRLGRFRGRIATQPGSTPLGSFSVPCVTCDEASPEPNIGPFGDRDQTQVFVQRVVPTTPQLVVRHASTGDLVCLLESVDGSHVTAWNLHECGMSSRVGARAHRFIISGHDNGTTQVWDLTTALERGGMTRQRSDLHAGGDAAADESSLMSSLETTVMMTGGSGHKRTSSLV